jgi:hypothetical protein
MVPKLRLALEKVETLSEQEQEALAERIIETIDAEERAWDELFARPDVLAALNKMGDEAIAEYRRGEAEPLDPNDS